MKRIILSFAVIGAIVISNQSCQKAANDFSETETAVAAPKIIDGRVAFSSTASFRQTLGNLVKNEQQILNGLAALPYRQLKEKQAQILSRT